MRKLFFSKQPQHSSMKTEKVNTWAMRIGTHPEQNQFSKIKNKKKTKKQKTQRTTRKTTPCGKGSCAQIR